MVNKTTVKAQRAREANQRHRTGFERNQQKADIFNAGKRGSGTRAKSLSLDKYQKRLGREANKASGETIEINRKSQENLK